MTKTVFVCVNCDRYKFIDTKWLQKPESEHLRLTIDKIKRKAICPTCTELIKKASKGR